MDPKPPLDRILCTLLECADTLKRENAARKGEPGYDAARYANGMAGLRIAFDAIKSVTDPATHPADTLAS
jgi:hypothetical protein